MFKKLKNKLKRKLKKRLDSARFQTGELFKFFRREGIRQPLGALKYVIDPNKRFLGRSKLKKKARKRKATGLAKIRYAITDQIRYWFGFLALLISFPFRFTKYLIVSSGVDGLWCLPAIATMIFLGFVTVRVVGSDAEIKERYRAGMTKALQAGDFSLARAYGERLILWPGETKRVDQMDWATCLLQTGEIALAVENLNELAPNDSLGHAPAHRVKALLLSQQFEASRDNSLLEPLYFHLNRSDDQISYAIRRGYSNYFMATNQPARAIPYLKSAALANPLLYTNLAAIYDSRNDASASIEALRKAEAGIPKILEANPKNFPMRVEYAKVLVNMKRQDDALNVLEEGWKLDPNPQLGRAIADFYSMLFDQEKDFDAQLNLIKRSWNYDPSYFKTYLNLIQKFEEVVSTEPDKGDQILETVKAQTIAKDAPAVAYFALSNICYMRGDEKAYQTNLEKAFEIDPQFSIAANNLAWMLAHDKDKLDLEKAAMLAEELVQKYPSNPRFRDTYGTILMKQGKFDLALNELEQVLNRIPNKGPVHSKLAEIYDRLEKPALANIHREKSVEFQMQKEN